MVGRLVALRESLVSYEDDGGAKRFGLVADFFLFRGDEGRDENSASRGLVEPSGRLLGEGFGRVFAADFHGLLVGVSEQEQVAVGFVLPLAYSDAPRPLKELRILPPHRQPVRILPNVAEEPVERAAMSQRFVAIVRSENIFGGKFFTG